MSLVPRVGTCSTQPINHGDANDLQLEGAENLQQEILELLVNITEASAEARDDIGEDVDKASGDTDNLLEGLALLDASLNLDNLAVRETLELSDKSVEDRVDTLEDGVERELSVASGDRNVSDSRDGSVNRGDRGSSDGRAGEGEDRGDSEELHCGGSGRRKIIL